MTPEELKQLGSLDAIAGEILRPGAEFTCGGISHKVID